MSAADSPPIEAQSAHNSFPLPSSPSTVIEGTETDDEEALEDRILEPIYHDSSPAAKRARLLMAVRAMVGELIGTCLLLYVQMGVPVVCHMSSVSVGLTHLAVAFCNCFITIAFGYSFSDVSGAHFNPAVTFACWVTKKTSNRKCIGYIIAQLIGVNLSMLLLWGSFTEPKVFDIVVVNPPVDDLGRVFCMEFLLTFTLIYVIFTVAFEDIETTKKSTMSIKGLTNSKGLTLYATNPQSRAGFAPLAIGLSIFSLSLLGSSISGGCINPARAFAPALWTNRWYAHWVYWLASFSGGASAALLRQFFEAQFGRSKDYLKKTRNHLLQSREVLAVSEEARRYSRSSRVSRSEVRMSHLK